MARKPPLWGPAADLYCQRVASEAGVPPPPVPPGVNSLPCGLHWAVDPQRVSFVGPGCFASVLVQEGVWNGSGVIDADPGPQLRGMRPSCSCLTQWLPPTSLVRCSAPQCSTPRHPTPHPTTEDNTTQRNAT